jgi:hypothetical protein
MPIQDADKPDRRPSSLSPFRHRIFLAIWIASLASNFGGLIQSVGAAWLMTSIGASADLIVLVQASTTLPIMLFSLMAGALADNFDRRQLMLAAQIFLLAVSVALTVCTYFGLVTPWLQRLVRGLSGRPVVYFRRPSQHAENRADPDGHGARRYRRGDLDEFWPVLPGGLLRHDRRIPQSLRVSGQERVVPIRQNPSAANRPP